MYPSCFLAVQEAEIRRITVQSQPGQIILKTLSQKYPIQNSTKGAAIVAQVVECLPSKCEALSSNSSAKKNKGKTCTLKAMTHCLKKLKATTH
jgi:mannosyltransferase OCH1-like enzyme